MDLPEVFLLYGIAPVRGGTAEEEDARSKEGRSFVDITVEAVQKAIPVQSTPPSSEGRNVVVEIDEIEYKKRAFGIQHSVIRWLFLQNKDATPTVVELQNTLRLVWKISKLKVIPIGRKFCHSLLNSMEDQSPVLSLRAVNLKHGVLCVSRWVPDFNPATQRQVNTQNWVRIYNLLVEYWKPSNLFNIARGTGVPLRIQLKPLVIENGVYARVMVDIDLSCSLLNRILVKRNKTNFFVGIECKNEECWTQQ